MGGEIIYQTWFPLKKNVSLDVNPTNFHAGKLYPTLTQSVY